MDVEELEAIVDAMAEEGGDMIDALYDTITLQKDTYCGFICRLREVVRLAKNEQKESAPVGNSAALREALLKAIVLLMACEWPDDAPMQDITEVMDEIRKALSAPQRNCDRFADELDAQLAFLNEVWLISIDRETMTEQDTYEKWTNEMRTRYGRWLLAPATEQKGETNGRS